jgi:hypothetical protein
MAVFVILCESYMGIELFLSCPAIAGLECGSGGFGQCGLLRKVDLYFHLLISGLPNGGGSGKYGSLLGTTPTHRSSYS